MQFVSVCACPAQPRSRHEPPMNEWEKLLVCGALINDVCSDASDDIGGLSSCWNAMQAGGLAHNLLK